MEPVKKDELEVAETVPAVQFEKEESILVASQWRLMWLRFKKHKLALVASVLIIIMYILALFADFFAPYRPDDSVADLTFAPPTELHFKKPDGGFSLRPYVYGMKQEIDPEALRRVFKPDPEKVFPVKFFHRGDEYKMLGVIKSNIHLFGIEGGEQKYRIYVWGADRMGRDVFTRVIFGSRISMSVGLLGVFISLILGITIGGFSGYFGGWFDNMTQRIIEFIRSIPHLPLWMALSAALPANWPPLRVYFGITVVLSLISWTGLARVVRSKFLSLREEDFVMAARLVGASNKRIVFRHMVPSFLSHIIASVTLAIPGMILGETSLSFLGLGLRPPVVSWGVLLQDAQNLRAVSQAPWLLIPGLAVMVAVLCFNFFGDGMRDAADPYGR